ncbi:hypothetical protein F2Q69_00036985 [Brassica cretica]|uniref:Uncharacterized protein n=1 Tax=Brassica cretica TaxID=69181 RepID=A0A8S9SK95_BRACR|nr:hypothetical protein F2Q69_00036985 [Brassica cretica]
MRTFSDKFFFEIALRRKNKTSNESSKKVVTQRLNAPRSDATYQQHLSSDIDFFHRSIQLEIPERSSCPLGIADSTLKSIDISSCVPDPDEDREITMENFLELVWEPKFALSISV